MLVPLKIETQGYRSPQELKRVKRRQDKGHFDAMWLNRLGPIFFPNWFQARFFSHKKIEMKADGWYGELPVI